MNVITYDFETYWDRDYSLSCMSPLEYVMGDRFESICCGIKVNGGRTIPSFGHKQIAEAFAALDVPNSILLAHNNSGFDSYIAAYRFGLKPKLWACTLAMASPEHAKTIGVSLAKLVKHYGVGVKDNSALLATKGKHRKDFTAQEMVDLSLYCCEDVDQCYSLWKILSRGFAASELWQIDAIIRMRTEPKFVLDVPLLNDALSVERSNKRTALLRLADMLRGESLKETFDWGDEDKVAEFVRAQLASPLQFSAILTARGVETPMKKSPSDPDGDKWVPALAKSDEEFIALQEHDDPVVAAAAQTRLAVKSTLLETRIGKFLTAASLAGGKLPVPIRYVGAYTTWRDSGEEYNMLNLPRINKKKRKVSDALRNSLLAGKGKKIIVADQSNIELRVNHTLWKVMSSMNLWSADPTADLYRADAAITYDCAPEDVTFDQRQLHKVKQLGLGFGSGPETFRLVAKAQYGLILTEEESEEAVRDWRRKYPEIAGRDGGWKTCHMHLASIRAGQEIALDPWGLATTCAEGIMLRTGRNHIIRYPDLREEFDTKTGKTDWVYGQGRHKARIYAGKIVENIVQALARDTIMDYTLDFFKLTGLRPALRPYDEPVYVVPEDEAEGLLATLQGVLRVPPRWWPELVVWSEGGIGDRYGEAK